ncbi:hypothetical protein GCM10007147_34540 [Nocardiopsis kunsanensis]|uniref:DUF2637 domain-containing protein n=1 Tax=Nocardiopsis kunsanensis TaxID=141693 RepID=A0A918XH12_9ACTN|nr:DUF2637 domain-containing protein [Nocardiopsis kunsanensis]GHD31619.1 hypothetical protein GCM10007147_34540 [Nocardiopsis kunsanensis]
MDTSRWSRWTTIVSVLILALIAAVVSYSHMYELALRHGEPEWRAALFPVSVDGMIVASSMTLLSDARNGRKGGLLPWALLIIGSGASLAANVAVADPTMWSRIIHAWPSFALIGAYELLMREFRANAAGVRSAHAGRTHGDEGSTEADEAAISPAPAERRERPHLHVVSVGEAVEDGGTEDGHERSDRFPPRVQREAWVWALENRQLDGSLPTGGQIAERFGRKERWGRLIKQWGQQGRLGPSLESSLTGAT